MSTNYQGDSKWCTGNSYKISVRRGKDLLKKNPRYIPKPENEGKLLNESSHMINSKVLRYPHKYDPYRYCFIDQQEEPSLFCGCISAKQFKEC
jgi:hypothetical protein